MRIAFGTVALALVAMASCLTARTAAAESISIAQEQDSGWWVVGYWGSLGQSFTAVDPDLTSVWLELHDANSSYANDALTTRLYEGVGMSGTLLGTVTQTVPAAPDQSQWVEWDFGFVPLDVGSTYSIYLSTPNLRWAVHASGGAGDVYAGGSTLLPDGTPGTSDLAFRIYTSDAVPVPEPGSLGLLLLATGVLGVGRRARRAARVRRVSAPRAR